MCSTHSALHVQHSLNLWCCPCVQYSDIKDPLPRPPQRKAPVVTETAPYSTHWGQHSTLGDLRSQREGMQVGAGWLPPAHSMHRVVSGCAGHLPLAATWPPLWGNVKTFTHGQGQAACLWR